MPTGLVDSLYLMPPPDFYEDGTLNDEIDVARLSQTNFLSTNEIGKKAADVVSFLSNYTDVEIIGLDGLGYNVMGKASGSDDAGSSSVKTRWGASIRVQINAEGNPVYFVVCNNGSVVGKSVTSNDVFNTQGGIPIDGSSQVFFDITYSGSSADFSADPYYGDGSIDNIQVMTDYDSRGGTQIRTIASFRYKNGVPSVSTQYVVADMEVVGTCINGKYIEKLKHF
jgi:hypothetical protein